MNKLVLLAAAAFAAVAAPAMADADVDFEGGSSDSSSQSSGVRELPPYLQCVPYARQVSGINIFGDAHTWWDQADGRYARGHKPKIGAVMAFRPHGNMRLGHVAAVSRILDSRTVLLRHANWSPIDGRRGQIENDVKAIDVSPGNDWSEVRVWYAPLQGIGTTAWPVEGFIYGDRQGETFARTRIAAETPQRVPVSAKAKPRDVVADIIARKS
jgi:surface antigen